MLALLRVIVAGTVFHFLVFLLYRWSLKVLEVSVFAAISSKKVALRSVVRAAPVAPLSGSRLLRLSRTVGVLSIVQVRISGLASVLPGHRLP